MTRRNWTAPRVRLLRLLHEARVNGMVAADMLGVTEKAFRSAKVYHFGAGTFPHILSETPLGDLQWLANQVERGDDLPAIMARIIRDARAAQRSGRVSSSSKG